MQKNKKATTGYLLAFFLGGIGAHHFYYRNYVRGIVYLLFFWTGIPMILGWIDMTSVNKWTARQNGYTQVSNTSVSVVENRHVRQPENLKEIYTATQEPVRETMRPARVKEETLKAEHAKEEEKAKQLEPDTPSSATEIVVANRANNFSNAPALKTFAVPSVTEPTTTPKIPKLKPANAAIIAQSETVAKEPAPNQTARTQENTTVQKTASILKEPQFFYSVKDIILPEYTHLKTPKHINDELNRIKSPKKTTSRQNGFVIEYSHGHSHENFVRESMKNAESRWTKTKEIPFQAYWPTFESLDKPKLRWYLYWREQVLKGNYLEVDLSYIFIFVYELINYSFNRHAAFNVSMMIRLLDNYKEQHPKLPKYLHEWLADMLYELGETEMATIWSKKQAQTLKLYQIIEEDPEQLSSLPISVWKPYIRTYRETEFYIKHKAKVNKKFKQSLPLIEKAYEREGTTLLAKWFEVKKIRTIRNIFNGAVVGRAHNPIHVYVTEFHPTQDLKNTAYNLLKLSENVVRLESGEKRQIKVDEELLPEGLKEEMMQLSERFKKVQEKSATSKGSTIPAAPSKENPIEVEVDKTAPVEALIEFDWQEIEAKNKALRELQEKIEDGEEDVEEEVSKKLNVSTSYANPGPHPSTVSSAKSLDDLMGDDKEDVAEFVSSLSLLEKEFVSRFEYGEIKEEKAKSFAKENSMMLGYFMTKLNEKANLHLGDILIEETDEGYEIFEDYKDVVLMVRSVDIEN
ncbi:TerB N-terminal domain-containing protein [Planococcus sp. N028]|uniref:TerB N-terminal domain-containing protein n=1 Tax=Planococcus shixiaomingii TaxID=3058393 RepID=A0ABT8N4P9_9BACL|nr:TerB N-terminal domain-containing protein [Planococcus sp. N028]MDN7242861.1 TerB N-terminal domain-containing protein [Planococcus sp. N028]